MANIKINNKTIIVVGLLIIIIILLGFRHNFFSEKPNIKIDGLADDWKGAFIQFLTDEYKTYRSNTDDYLYIMIKPKNITNFIDSTIRIKAAVFLGRNILTDEEEVKEENTYSIKIQLKNKTIHLQKFNNTNRTIVDDEIDISDRVKIEYIDVIETEIPLEILTIKRDLFNSKTYLIRIFDKYNNNLISKFLVTVQPIFRLF